MALVILGGGAMGTALALVLAQQQGRACRLWVRRPELAATINRDRENKEYLPGFPLPPEIEIVSAPAAALAGAELIVAAFPTVHLRATASELAPHIPARAPVVSVAKGLEQGTFLRPSEMLTDLWGPRPVAALCGPSHAEELARRLPASLVVASPDPQLARTVQETFSTERFRVYTNDDLCGVELAGALKNVIAIAAGVCDGLRLGDNAKSALLTRGLVEMVRFGTAQGGKRETFYGLAGIGDLITTCVSPYGRNLAVGRQLGSGKKLPEILTGMHSVAEGVWTSRAIRGRALELGLEMPITEAVCRVLFDDHPPADTVRELMLRSRKSEWM